MAVEIEHSGNAVQVLLNLPDSGNAFSDALVAGLDRALDEIETASCATVVFQGAGKGFCGGLDLSDLESQTDASLLDRLIRIEMILQRIANLPQRTVALVHRFAYGAGADLAVACRHRIAAPGTRFAFPGVRFGILLGTGRLARLVGEAQARTMLMQVAPLAAEDALRIGMIDDLVSQQDWDGLIARLAAEPAPYDTVTAHHLAARLRSNEEDRDLAALVRSAARPGLRDRVARYAAAAKKGPRQPA
ncbi:enoyl-CoA hydratase/isomerase family protein [Paracoccus thiocyanatus]|uniref:Enoyl-CoA hydratase/isomerase family protein n=2 Tax=Paracoccus thiocyanatus TaxID=34006 RepID=A0A3D8PBN9_9RHOB|nr:enoyl-CoA hydratase/isomerase family protein [Paracoccus thiocyanatus]